MSLTREKTETKSLSTNLPSMKKIKTSSEKSSSKDANNEHDKEEDPQDDKKWDYFEHNGVYFPENWIRHNVPILYKNAKRTLDAHQEEIATYWAQTLGSEWENKPFYVKNFSKMFIESFENENEKIKEHLNFKDFDFSPIKEYLTKEKEKKDSITSEQKLKNVEAQELINNQYKLLLVDDRIEKVANFRIEPPTLFKGRGEHPKAGILKQRTVPEDVDINISPDSIVPICHLPGRSWNKVVFKNESIWLASYLEDGTNNRKYIQLSASSLIKTKNDMKKYERARRLKNQIGKIRDDYRIMMKSDIMKDKQLGTAAYFIDFLAIRVGNEKKEDEADTVGCCSLRKEHVKILPDHEITLDFLGKDSMRYLNTVKIDPIAHENLVIFTKNKSDSQMIFDLIDSGKLNEYLQNLMEDLTAKVFRTYNASNTLQTELDKSKDFIKPEDSLEKKMEFYNKANRSVAVLCNHQKGISKNYEKSHQKSMEGIEEMKKELKLAKKNNTEKAKLEKLCEKISKNEKLLEVREENKSIALNTSKINYNDPRISVSWCKKYEVPIEKIFTSVLLEKFNWAMEFEMNWKF